MSDLTPVSTWSRNRRHLAVTADLKENSHGGRFGTPLCFNQTRADVYDQEALDADALRFDIRPGRRVVDMPPCKRCEKAVAASQVGADT